MNIFLKKLSIGILIAAICCPINSFSTQLKLDPSKSDRNATDTSNNLALTQKIIELSKIVNELNSQIIETKNHEKISILELKETIAQLKMSDAETKKGFFDSSLGYINCFMAVVTFIMGFLALVGIKNFNEMKKDNNNFIEQASKKIAAGLTEDYTRLIEKIFRNNYSKQIDKINDNLADLQNKVSKLEEYRRGPSSGDNSTNGNEFADVP